jgi:hypothetical protein
VIEERKLLFKANPFICIETKDYNLFHEASLLMVHHSTFLLIIIFLDYKPLNYLYTEHVFLYNGTVALLVNYAIEITTNILETHLFGF